MSKVISLKAFKQKKDEQHWSDETVTENFDNRINRIRTSLERINTLMTEFKKISHKPTRDLDEEKK